MNNIFSLKIVNMIYQNVMMDSKAIHL